MSIPYEATNLYAGDGEQVDFHVTFAGGYLRQQDLVVWVELDGVVSVPSWAFLSPGVIRVVPTPPAGSQVYIRRNTPATPLVQFVAGALLNEKNLDLASKQALFVAVEARDAVAGYEARLAELESPTPALSALSALAGESLAAGQVVRLHTDGKLYRWYGSDHIPHGLCVSNTPVGEIVACITEGEFDGGWAFLPGVRLFAGVDSYPTTTIPTEGVLCEIGVGWPGRIYFKPELPTRLS